MTMVVFMVPPATDEPGPPMATPVPPASDEPGSGVPFVAGGGTPGGGGGTADPAKNGGAHNLLAIGIGGVHDMLDEDIELYVVVRVPPVPVEHVLPASDIESSSPDASGNASNTFMAAFFPSGDGAFVPSRSAQQGSSDFQ